MITRAKRNANYEYIELPSTKRKRTIKKNVANTSDTNDTNNTSDTIYVANTNVENTSINEPYAIYAVDIDFDEAHNEWMKNKIKLKNGCYRYKKEKGRR